MTTLPKTVTAEKAVQAIRSNDDVVLANFCSEPRYLPMALMERAKELNNVRLFHMSVQGSFVNKYLEKEMEHHIRCATPFCGRNKIVRQAISEGKADYYPTSFSRIPDILRKGNFKSDVFMLTISPPDSDGYCNLGISVDYAWGVIERPARTIIAEMNPYMPRTQGRTKIHISKIDYIVEVNEPLYELPQSQITDIEKHIGGYVSELVDDGATLQIGYGGMSESVIYFLKDKHNLGIHTEMVPEGLKELILCGAVNNSQKSIHKGKIICTFNAGTKSLYSWLDNNPLIEMYPVDYTNNPQIIAANNHLIAINTALQVDLYGNIYADMLGLGDQYSGVGGQLDFALGCAMSTDAKFINVLPSTSNSGKISRIVTHPSIENINIMASQIPTVPRFCSDYVVTEYGITQLKGKTNRERANGLINIAHPDYRDILRTQAHRLGLI
jgi:4-hydroxybutyrate CoA-transferase